MDEGTTAGRFNHLDQRSTLAGARPGSMLLATPSLDTRTPPLIAHDAVFVNMCPRKSKFTLCQNCVTYPLKPPVKTTIYGEAPTHIDVAEVVDAKVSWCVSMSVSTRRESISKRHRPLGHLSV
jgi:hypothetical protein